MVMTEWLIFIYLFKKMYCFVDSVDEIIKDIGN